MHARDTIELAALIATHGAGALRGDAAELADAIVPYWTAAKLRLDRWLRALRRADAPGMPREALVRAWQRRRPVVEEILTAEVLARVWTGVLTIHAASSAATDAAAIAQSVLLGHLEARLRVLTLLAHAPHHSLAEIRPLDLIRRRAERWSDLLIARLSAVFDVTQFAANPDRAREFALEHTQSNAGAAENARERLMQAAQRAAFQHGLSPVSPNADLNAQVASSVVRMLNPNLFDGHGVPHSLWFARLSNAADDTQGMIDELYRWEGRGVKGEERGMTRW